MFLRADLFSDSSQPLHERPYARWDVSLWSQQTGFKSWLHSCGAGTGCLAPLGLSLLSCQMEGLWSDRLGSGLHIVGAH